MRNFTVARKRWRRAEDEAGERWAGKSNGSPLESEAGEKGVGLSLGCMPLVAAMARWKGAQLTGLIHSFNKDLCAPC